MESDTMKTEKPQKLFVQPCVYADLMRGSADAVTCGAYYKTSPADHCGPKCPAYRPMKGSA